MHMKLSLKSAVLFESRQLYCKQNTIPIDAGYAWKKTWWATIFCII